MNGRSVAAPYAYLLSAVLLIVSAAFNIRIFYLKLKIRAAEKAEQTGAVDPNDYAHLVREAKAQFGETDSAIIHADPDTKACPSRYFEADHVFKRNGELWPACIRPEGGTSVDFLLPGESIELNFRFRQALPETERRKT